jgi:alkylation response protein AidB-like acyl-CoA dehydrogenase
MSEISVAGGLSSESRPRLVRALLEDFARTAAERDAIGGTAKRERDLIRASGLLRLTIPQELGGAGSDLNEALTLTRQMAGADASLAHLFAFHHLMLATLRLYGPREQWAPLLERTAQEGWFWGNALNPLDRRTRIEPAGLEGVYRISGTKSFCSGASDSDMLIVSALRPDEPGLVVAAVPTRRQGIRIHDDWDNIGQRQTDSGSVSFEQVTVFEGEILRRPGPLGSAFASLRSCIAQLILANIYLGIAEGALAEAARYVSQTVHPWAAAGVEHIEEDPYTLRNFGEYWVETAAAAALTDRAQQKLQNAFSLGEAVDPPLRAEVAVEIATSKVASARAALNVSSRIFEVLGARATVAKLRFDRFWRNARTHTLHDPLDYKLRELGSWALARKPPVPSFYS